MTLVAARENMVDSQIRTDDVGDPALQAALRHVARERFCAPGQAALAYADRQPEIAPGRALLQPRDAGKLLQALRPRAGERALTICEPYLAAVLAEAGCEVVAFDTAAVNARVGEAVGEAGAEVVTGDPAALAVDGAFDVIAVGGAVVEVPPAWFALLEDGGRLGAVVRSGPVGRATLFVRSGDATTGRAAFDAAPIHLPGLEPKAAFAF